MRPPSIVLFERLYYVKIVLGVLAGIWVYSTFAIFSPPADAPGWLLTLMPFVKVGSVLLQVLIGLALIYFIARRGSEIAKWIFIILFAIGAVSVLRGLMHTGAFLFMPSPLRVLGIVEVVLELFMLILLFRPDAKPWFAGRRGPQGSGGI